MPPVRYGSSYFRLINNGDGTPSDSDTPSKVVRCEQSDEPLPQITIKIRAYIGK